MLQGAEQGSELELELPLQPDKSKGHIKVPRPSAMAPPLALRCGAFGRWRGAHRSLRQTVGAECIAPSAQASGHLAFSIKLCEEEAIGRIWTAPSVARAEEHKCRSRPWDDSKPFPFPPHRFRSPFLSQGSLGEGIALWIKFLKVMALLFLLLFVLNLPGFLFYLHGAGFGPELRQGQGVLSLPSIGNLFSTQQIGVNMDAARVDDQKVPRGISYDSVELAYGTHVGMTCTEHVEVTSGVLGRFPLSRSF